MMATTTTTLIWMKSMFSIYLLVCIIINFFCRELLERELLLPCVDIPQLFRCTSKCIWSSRNWYPQIHSTRILALFQTNPWHLKSFCPHDYIVDVVLSHDDSPKRLRQVSNLIVSGIGMCFLWYSIERANSYLSECFSDFPSKTGEPTADSNLASLVKQTSVPYDCAGNNAHSDPLGNLMVVSTMFKVMTILPNLLLLYHLLLCYTL